VNIVAIRQLRYNIANIGKPASCTSRERVDEDADHPSVADEIILTSQSFVAGYVPFRDARSIR
jgi:hypothetical protein